jgi:hypothetical protein
MTCGSFEQVVNERLVRLSFVAGEPAQAVQQTWIDTNPNQLLRIRRFWPADSSPLPQFFVGRFRNIGKINLFHSLTFPSGHSYSLYIR